MKLVVVLLILFATEQMKQLYKMNI